MGDCMDGPQSVHPPSRPVDPAESQGSGMRVRRAEEAFVVPWWPGRVSVLPRWGGTAEGPTRCRLRPLPNPASWDPGILHVEPPGEAATALSWSRPVRGCRGQSPAENVPWHRRRFMSLSLVIRQDSSPVEFYSESCWILFDLSRG